MKVSVTIHGGRVRVEGLDAEERLSVLEVCQLAGELIFAAEMAAGHTLRGRVLELLRARHTLRQPVRNFDDKPRHE